MDTYIQISSLAGESDGMFERSAGSHQRCGGEYSFAARMHDALIDVAREAEIVGVDDQLFQNNDSFTCRNFFGLARKSCISKFI